MELAKQHIDVGLFTDNAAPMLEFWQQRVGLAFEETLPLGGGVLQHRHAMNGSVLTLNASRDPLPAHPISGYRELFIAREALAQAESLVDPDGNRVTLVLAVLSRHCGIGLGAADVFVNVAGGVRVEEPGADLAVALAVASAARGVALGGSAAEGGPPLACFGEVGLTGELRSVAHADRRLAEAAKFGLGPVVEPGRSGTLGAALGDVLGRGRRPDKMAA